ncbi:putative glycerol-3-phosphate dehydrogenase [NAD(+)] 1, cytosolic [Camellia lanceoleosa]|uniref:Glycerol-3-phosphate dehydrogenase [NAD(+)] 1, cytosolic n=1 Tax=Camellia lanceoleosa TaxID=1840588 RepID=A0ACC0FWT6_9ERIC|nr:putative glycerol-3-phosphate dehydrogenase [NAD(+)] 1, cytosolic [Camellia lanceoleosa]
MAYKPRGFDDIDINPQFATIDIYIRMFSNVNLHYHDSTVSLCLALHFHSTREVAELRHALADKQEQENVMLQVLMRVEQEQRVTEDAHRFVEQDAAAQRYAAQVLQVVAGSIEAEPHSALIIGVQNHNGLEEKLDDLRRVLGKAESDLLRIAGVGAGAWGSVFAALLQDSYGQFQIKFKSEYGGGRRAVDKATAEHLFEVINSRKMYLERLIRRCAYLKYVEARLGDGHSMQMRH